MVSNGMELEDSYLASPHVSHSALVPQVAHLGIVTPRGPMLKIGHILLVIPSPQVCISHSPNSWNHILTNNKEQLQKLL